jgi:hypothetical protein
MPDVPDVREPVTEDDGRALTLLGDVERDAIRPDLPVGYIGHPRERTRRRWSLLRARLGEWQQLMTGLLQGVSPS